MNNKICVPVAGKDTSIGLGLAQPLAAWVHLPRTEMGLFPFCLTGVPVSGEDTSHGLKGEITLETQWENSLYSITNALGKEVQTGLIGQPSQKIQVSNLPEGYYQISVIHDGIRSVKSLIIQK